MTDTEPATTTPPPAVPHEPPEAELALTVIEPGDGRASAVLAEVWRFRELLLFLAWRNIKIRYKQTVIGVLWAVLQPVAVMGVLVFAFKQIAGDPNSPVPYWLFALAGLVPWTFLSSAVNGTGMSVVLNQHLVTKVYFPRVLLPLSAVGVAGVDLMVGGVALAVAVAFMADPGWHPLAVPLVLAVMFLVASGIGLLLAAVTVKFRDFRVLMPLFVQMWLFLTPAIYDQTGKAGRAFGPLGEAVQMANPANGVVLNFRAAVLGTPFDWPALAVSALVGTVLFGLGLWYFHKAERAFADVI